MTRIFALISILVALPASGCAIYFGDDGAQSGDGAGAAGGDSSAPGSADEPAAQCATMPRGEVILDCAEDAGYQVDSWQTGTPSSPGLHLVSVYETRQGDPQEHAEGEARVVFDLAGSHVLALSAYEPTHWFVDVTPGAKLDKIVVFGYHEQVVSAPAGVPVEVHATLISGGDYQPCGYSLPYNDGGCDTDALIADVEAVTGLALSSFNGCYRASEFMLSNAGEQCGN